MKLGLGQVYVDSKNNVIKDFFKKEPRFGDNKSKISINFKAIKK